MVTYCGLDFGTSNTALGSICNSELRILPLEDSKTSIPSAIFFHFKGDQTLYGRRAIEDYVDGEFGRLMLGIKNVLGTDVMHGTTQIKYSHLSYTEIITNFLKHIRKSASHSLESDLRCVTMGRPVYFSNASKEADEDAQKVLEQAALDAGFSEVVFQFEPIAAALSYEESLVNEELVLVYDIGGGTSDFTIIRLSPDRRLKHDRSQDILANGGIHIGGTDFDRNLSLKSAMPFLGHGNRYKGRTLQMPSSYYRDLATWHAINNLYNPQVIARLREIRPQIEDETGICRLINVLEQQNGHCLALEVERAKQTLSTESTVVADFQFIESLLLPVFHREDFELSIEHEVNEISRCVAETVAQAQISPSEIKSIFVTGGSSEIPIIRNSIKSLFPDSRIVNGDVFSSVARGLTLDAQRRFS